MQAQKQRARAARADISGWSDNSKSKLHDLPKTVFTGYTDYRSPAKVLAIFVDDEAADMVSEGTCTVVLDRTPFYGESGGQVGDKGTIYTQNDTTLLNVQDTQKRDGIYLHLCTVVSGVLQVGGSVIADINDETREAIRRNHSACHLLQAALRKVLGTHVQQAGSYVDDERVRFDFTHVQALSDEELSRVESLVNANILVGNTVTTTETDMETAQKSGAMALFGEKYGKVVRMVRMAIFPPNSAAVPMSLTQHRSACSKSLPNLPSPPVCAVLRASQGLAFCSF